jgi:hypothetical protein
MSTELQKAKVDGDQPIHSDVSSHGPYNCKQKIAPFYGLDLFVRATLSDSPRRDHKFENDVDI